MYKSILLVLVTSFGNFGFVGISWDKKSITESSTRLCTFRLKIYIQPEIFIKFDLKKI